MNPRRTELFLLFVGFCVLLGACRASQSKVDISLSSHRPNVPNENGDLILEVAISSDREVEIVIFDAIQDYLTVTSIESEIVDRPALRLNNRKSDEVVVAISPSDPYILYLDARTEENTIGKFLNLGAIGRVLANKEGRVSFRLNLYPKSVFFDSGDGVSSNSIELDL